MTLLQVWVLLQQKVVPFTSGPQVFCGVHVAKHVPLVASQKWYFVPLQQFAEPEGQVKLGASQLTRQVLPALSQNAPCAQHVVLQA